MFKHLILKTLFFAFFAMVSISGYGENNNVKTVYVVFKTHLDVGFTDLSSAVTKRYVEDFIPKAIAVANRMRADNQGDRFVWTTGSWLIWRYLHSASPEAVATLDSAIRRGDIVWNAMPYTIETESMTHDLVAATMEATHKLDRRYGKHTIAGKMTDVPGHTRSLVSVLHDAGIRYLHIGVNPASAIPNVPEFCRWRDTNGKEVILNYQKDYGSECTLPDGKTVVAINMTGDNNGPQTYEQVKAIYADLHRRFPQAHIQGASLNDVARELLKIKKTLPVVTSEIGDTWIYGYGSAPIRMAKFRTLCRLYSQWLHKGKIDPRSDATLNFALELGLIGEHTQGLDVKTHLGNWDKYDMDAFTKARSSAPFQKMERSWKELDDYISHALVYLPAPLQLEAQKALAAVDSVTLLRPVASAAVNVADKTWSAATLDGGLHISGLSYQMLSHADYNQFINRYLRARYDWAVCDFGKPGLDCTHAVSADIQAHTLRSWQTSASTGVSTVTDLQFPATDSVDSRVYPEAMQVCTWSEAGGTKLHLAVTLFHKPAVRLPEAYWLSFRVDGIKRIVAEKLGEPVDLMDVVERGNRQMHAIDRYVDLYTDHGTYRIWSDEAFLVNVGEPRGLDYSTQKPNLHGGIHFNLSNNLWGTNFTMWNEGSLTYHFCIEKLGK